MVVFLPNFFFLTIEVVLYIVKVCHNFVTSSLFICQIKCITTNCYSDNEYQKHSLNNILKAHYIKITCFVSMLTLKILG